MPVSLYGAKLILINTSLSDHGYGPGDQYPADVLIGCVSFIWTKETWIILSYFFLPYHQRLPYI